MGGMQREGRKGGEEGRGGREGRKGGEEKRGEEGKYLSTPDHVKRALTATYLFFPKKHMPMLFQRWGDSGRLEAATRYLAKATSKSS